MLLHWVASKIDRECQELVLDTEGYEDCLDDRKREELKSISTYNE